MFSSLINVKGFDRGLQVAARQRPTSPPPLPFPFAVRPISGAVALSQAAAPLPLPMAAKQAAPGEALAAQINAMSRSEMYDMMSKMKVRPYPQSPNPTSPIPLSSLLSSAPLSTRRFVHRFALLFFTVFFMLRHLLAQTMIDHDQETVRRMLVDNPDVTRALFRVRFLAAHALASSKHLVPRLNPFRSSDVCWALGFCGLLNSYLVNPEMICSNCFEACGY